MQRIRAAASLTGWAAKIPLIPHAMGKIQIKGIKNKICRRNVITMDGMGFAMDWKKVVTSMTKPRIGVMQKLVRRPITPISSISSVAPKAMRIASGKNITIIQIIQVIPTDNPDA